MKFFFDESGSFRTDSGGGDDIGVVVGVSIPDSLHAGVAEQLDIIFQGLQTRRPGNNEIKSADLDESDRRRVCSLVDRCQRVVVRPIIVDMRHFRGGMTDVIRREFADGLDQEARFPLLPDSNRAELNNLSKWHSRLSDNQFVKVYAWAVCLDRLLREAAFQIVPTDEHPAWKTLEFVIDGQAKDATMREGRFFALMVQHWMLNWAWREPYAVVSADGDSHPLHKFWLTEDRIDVRKLIENGLRFGDSRTTPGIQLADIAASIVRRAALAQDRDADALFTYGWLMKATPVWLGRGIGLISPQETTESHDPMFTPMAREYTLAQVRRELDRGAEALITGPAFGEVPQPVTANFNHARAPTAFAWSDASR